MGTEEFAYSHSPNGFVRQINEMGERKLGVPVGSRLLVNCSGLKLALRCPDDELRNDDGI